MITNIFLVISNHFISHKTYLYYFSTIAEGQTDRHNMTLFLQWDTEREQPVGFEKRCLNFFDPAEDDQDIQHFRFEDDDIEEDQNNTNKDDSNDKQQDNQCDNDNPQLSTALTQTSHESSFARDNKETHGRIRARTTKVRHSPKRNRFQCIRPGCKRKPRFDSAFCSDGCGVLTMEKDLLYSLKYAIDMHPYELRP